MAQHYGDHRPVTIYQPPHFDSTLHGQGRWFDLEHPLGRVVATIYTDDRERLGFLQRADDDLAIAVCQTLGAAFRGASKVSARTTDVFEYWAGRATQVQGAGPVRSGRLETLLPPDPEPLLR